MKGRVYFRRLTNGAATYNGQRGSWSFMFDGPRKPDGSRNQVTGHGFKSQREAGAVMRDKQVAADKGTFRQPTKETLDELIKSYLEANRPETGKLRESTWNCYDTLRRAYVSKRIGQIVAQKLEPEHLDALYADLLKSGAVKGGPLSPTTVKRVHTLIHAALKYGLKKRKLVTNVADLADAPSEANPTQDVWTADELNAFLSSAREGRLYPLWHLGAATGARRGELLGLPWNLVDLEKGAVTFNQSLNLPDGSKPQLGEIKTRAGKRTVALDPQTVAVLRSWRKTQAEERLSWGEAYSNPHNLVFTREDGSWLHPERASEWFDQAWKGSGVNKRITMHGLRHTHATLGLKAGIQAKVMQERLGHSSIKVTLDYYGHVLEGMDADAATIFGTKILSERG